MTLRSWVYFKFSTNQLAKFNAKHPSFGSPLIAHNLKHFGEAQIWGGISHDRLFIIDKLGQPLIYK